ncbi:C-type lectin domain family 4 member F-like [Cloeon dipterum]|uniref:C-type lectin domain family 4 member F-like n=1 Tax=Cloeon dipterum TaxID=197152 RepID=UPI00321F747B
MVSRQICLVLTVLLSSLAIHANDSSPLNQELRLCKRDKRELQNKLNEARREAEDEKSYIINKTAKFCDCKKRNLNCIFAGTKLNMMRLNTGLYYANHSKVAWKAADNFCKSHGLHLVEIETRSELAEVEKIQTESSYWTSGTDKDESGKYIWTTSKREVNPMLWYLSQPDSFGPGRVTCVNLQHERLFDDPCDHEYGFICEMPRECQ